MLIKCSECGKEISDKAKECIYCGCPIENNNTSDLESKNNTSKVVYYHILDTNGTITFSNGLEDKTTGFCYDNNHYEHKCKYRVEGNNLFILRGTNREVKYIIANDYLVCDNGCENYSLPNDNLFNLSFKNDYEDIKYSDDGTYTEKAYGHNVTGRYKRSGNILVKKSAFTGNNTYGYLVYDNMIYDASLVKEDKIEELRNLYNNFNKEINEERIFLKQENSKTIYESKMDFWLKCVAVSIIAIIVLFLLAGNGFASETYFCGMDIVFWIYVLLMVFTIVSIVFFNINNAKSKGMTGSEYLDDRFNNSISETKAVFGIKPKSPSPSITCPYCHSTNVSKIGTVDRGLSVGMTGLASGKLGKQWHCNKCKSNF